MKRAASGILLLLVSSIGAFGQCAMCRATLENNLSNGNVGLAAGINIGILYLFLAPYLSVALIAFFWYRTSRKNANDLTTSTTSR